MAERKGLTFWKIQQNLGNYNASIAEGIRSINVSTNKPSARLSGKCMSAHVTENSSTNVTCIFLDFHPGDIIFGFRCATLRDRLPLRAMCKLVISGF